MMFAGTLSCATVQARSGADSLAKHVFRGAMRA
jgi:hypothetical protein